MDTRGARHLRARLAIGAAVGERVEVVSVEPGAVTPVQTGDIGELIAIDEDIARLRLDDGSEHAVDPSEVQLRRCA